MRLVIGASELHSGLYGGAAANAVHDLLAMLAAVVGHEDEFADGIAPVTGEERAGWAALPTGAEELAAAGARPRDDRGRAEFYERTWARPVADGALDRRRRSDCCTRPASRWRRGRRSRFGWRRARTRSRWGPAGAAAARGLPRPRHARARAVAAGEPAYVSPDDLRARPASLRSSGRPGAAADGAKRRVDPGDAALVARGMPTVLSGFGTTDDNIHSPNENMHCGTWAGRMTRRGRSTIAGRCAPR